MIINTVKTVFFVRHGDLIKVDKKTNSENRDKKLCHLL